MENEFKVSNDLLASQGQRFLNYIIDIIVFYVLFIIIAILIGFFIAIIGSNMGNVFASMSEGVATLYCIFILISYYVIFEGFFSRTVGKFITKTIVVNEDGSKPGFGTIIKRTLCRFIPFDAFSYLGGYGRGWHDTIPNIYVVKKDLFEEKKELFYSFEQIGEKEEQIN